MFTVPYPFMSYDINYHEHILFAVEQVLKFLIQAMSSISVHDSFMLHQIINGITAAKQGFENNLKM